MAELLQRARIVTLTGSGGVGKTRLALAVAAGLVDAYADGVWLVDLAPLATPTLVPGAVAQALKLGEESGRSPIETVREYLRHTHALLVLDNCEHLIGACAQLASDLLRSCPDLRILATSREILAVNGEQRYRVPSLTIPAAEPSSSPGPVEGYEAVQLFVARAQERQADFVLTAQNIPAVAEICTRLEGIPLAIELAAARVGSMSVEQIAARLDARFRLLTGGARTAQPRQQTLRALLDWGHDLLSDTERAVLWRLSAFVGGWTLEAAEQVCVGGAVAEWDVLELLGQLEHKSWVFAEQREGEMRFSLLETVRQYAGEKLLAAGEAAASADRHLDWCRALAERAEPSLVGPEQRQAMSLLEREHGNLRTALWWALAFAAGGDPVAGRRRAAQGLQTAASLWRFWYMRGHFSEGRSFLEQLLARASSSGVDAAAVRATALHGAGVLAYSQGDYAAAHTLCEESLALYRALGDRHGVAVALNILANVAVSQGEYGRAVALSEQSLALHRELGSERGIAVALNNLGHVLVAHGDFERQGEPQYGRAERLFAESLALNRNLGDSRGTAIALANLGEVAMRRRDYTRAMALCDESLALMRESGDIWGISAALNTLAEIAYDQGDDEQALQRYAECLALRAVLSDRVGIAACLAGMAGVTSRRGCPERAVRLCAAVSALFTAGGVGLPPVARTIFDATLSATRAALTADVFAAAWQEGATAPVEATIRAALGAVDRRSDMATA